VIVLELALYFAALSMVAFGGMPAVMPEMQRFVVEVKGWTTPAEFTQLFAVAQAAPGPNVLIVSLIGWKVGGLAGALVGLVSVCAPAAAIAWWVTDLWERFKDSPWRAAIQKAIAPLVVGLILSGGYVLATPHALPEWRMWLIAGAAAAMHVAFTKLNPLWILAGGAALGAVLLS
jgi:chromate transporter